MRVGLYQNLWRLISVALMPDHIMFWCTFADDLFVGGDAWVTRQTCQISLACFLCPGAQSKPLWIHAKTQMCYERASYYAAYYCYFLFHVAFMPQHKASWIISLGWSNAFVGSIANPRWHWDLCLIKIFIGSFAGPETILDRWPIHDIYYDPLLIQNDTKHQVGPLSRNISLSPWARTLITAKNCYFAIANLTWPTALSFSYIAARVVAKYAQKAAMPSGHG